jgi:hypothetical protein
MGRRWTLGVWLYLGPDLAQRQDTRRQVVPVILDNVIEFADQQRRLLIN